MNDAKNLQAIRTAATTLVRGLQDGGEVAKICDVEIRAPKSEYSDRIQEIHIKVIHILVMLIEQEVKQ
jgi:phosphoheptose isomerase